MPEENGASPETEDSGLYDLSEVPEEYREHVEPHLKAMEGNVTKRFQEAADFRKQWEPYQELGISDIEPDTLKQLLDFANMAQDPEQLKGWVDDLRQRMGWEEDTEEFDSEEGLSKDEVKKLLDDALAEKLTPVYETLTGQQRQAAEQQATHRIEEVLSALQQEKGIEFTDAQREDVLNLAYPHVEEGTDPQEAIQTGFEAWQRIRGEGESQLFEKKAKQPQSPEGPGAASTSPAKIVTWEDAHAASAEMFKQSAKT